MEPSNKVSEIRRYACQLPLSKWNCSRTQQVGRAYPKLKFEKREFKSEIPILKFKFLLFKTLMFDFGEYFKGLFAASGRKSSAMSPLLWLNALVTIPCLMGSFLISDSFRYAPLGIAVIIILFTLKKYNDLTNKDPRLVQSEWFQIEQHKLDVVAQKGGPVIFEPVSIPLSSPPKQLKAGETNEQEDDQ